MKLNVHTLKTLRYSIILFLVLTCIFPVTAQRPTSAGWYRIVTKSDAGSYYLWPSTTTTGSHNVSAYPNENQYVTTYNEISAVQTSYPSTNTSWGDLDPTYSIWKVEIPSSGVYTFTSFGYGKKMVYTGLTSNDISSLLELRASATGSITQFTINAAGEIFPNSVNAECIIPFGGHQNALSGTSSTGTPDNNRRYGLMLLGTPRLQWSFDPVTLDKPVITYNQNTNKVTISHPDLSYAYVYYTTDGTNPSSSSTRILYSPELGGTGPFMPTAGATIRALAEFHGGNGLKIVSAEADPLTIPSIPTVIHLSSKINDDIFNSANQTGSYTLADDFVIDETVGVREGKSKSFKGTINGCLNTIAGTTTMPFIAQADGAVIKNVIIEKVNISGGTNTGAICNELIGTSDKIGVIYNCGVLGGSISGSGNVGGLVGNLGQGGNTTATNNNCYARVINCYSFATITQGDNVGGIVGCNNYSTNSSNIRSMVMNCMFYGDITGGTTISPIYGGTIISNAGNTGVGNYNYFRLEAPYVQPTGVIYNCALGAEDRFLQRFEFFRHLLNGHRELAGWWATGTYSSSEMMKWVLLPDSIGSSHPYPILMEQGKYPSVVNIDAEHATSGKPRNQGGKLGTLTVNIQMGNGAVYNHPGTGANEAKIVTPQLVLNITDKDPDHYNFNYYKVQLPYYNDVGTKNYTGNRVVTGWKIVSITGGTPGTFTTSDTWGGYNFADRNCTNKDLYGTGGSNRIFNQGAYWDVPEGVTAITIEPYWARCVYLADPNADKVYNADMTTGYNVSNVGGGSKFTNGNSYSIAGDNQVVYTSMGNAIASSGSALFSGVDANSHSVYDYAVVLVGNYHHYYATNKIEASKSKPYTITSVDLDGDNEPDYSYMLRFDGRSECHPVRVDFINIPGLGMAQKSTGGTGSYNFGILIPKGWYESTNTSLLRFTQFEYEHSARSTTDAIIVQGGVMEQWVSNNQKGTSNNIPYIHVGGNVWFKEFHTGCHQDKQIATKHSPISVTGGDYDEFYLTGLYRGDFNNKEDNAECYINGGRFGTVCGAAMEGIGKANGANNTGNISWLIQNADIKEFYAGGLNAAKPVTGNLNTTIVDSHVDIFCGGPKFGDMSNDKTVVTNATGCTFGTFFGAGYGGNSYNRFAPTNQNNVTNINWNNWIRSNYTQAYDSNYGGVSTRFNYQFLPMSDNKTNVARILIDFVKFSLATTHSVTSTLTGCTVTGNYYGGGSLGKVDGNVTSTLNNCTMKGNVFGAGFSASYPTVQVDAIGFETEPYYYDQLGTYRTGVKYKTNPDFAPTTYTWEHGDAISIDKTNHILYTTEDLSKTNLGSVNTATLTLTGNTTVGTQGNSDTGNVYGGGDESTVSGNTTVTIEGDTEVLGNVYGGGNRGAVGGDSEVKILDSSKKAK